MSNRSLRTPTSTASIRSRPAWLPQVFSDLQRHEGFRQFAYPDPYSKLGLAFPAGKKYRWGFRPATEILAELGASAAGGRPWTVGYGFTRGVNERTFISKEYADRKLESEILDHAAELDALFPGWRTDYPRHVQEVLVNMVFNLGQTKLAKFNATINLIKDGHYRAAGENLKRTLWYKQVGPRAVELTTRLIKGEVDPKHKV